MVDSEDREKKQQYLRDEIIDKDYDSSQFLAFLIERNGEDAADIDAYSFSELVAIVKQFTDSHKPECQSAQKIHYDSDPEEKTPVEEIKENPKKE